MKFNSPIVRMFKAYCAPKGSLDVSILKLDRAAAFNSNFMEQIYKELDVAITMKMLGEELSPCQKLVINVLTDSADLSSDPDEFGKSLKYFIDFENKKLN